LRAKRGENGNRRTNQRRRARCDGLFARIDSQVVKRESAYARRENGGPVATFKTRASPQKQRQQHAARDQITAKRQCAGEYHCTATRIETHADDHETIAMATASDTSTWEHGFAKSPSAYDRRIGRGFRRRKVSSTKLG
jgi:hypothetical protein